MSLAEDIPHAAPRFRSAEDFIAWASGQEERYELVDGAARMFTGGSPDHARLSRNLLTTLAGRLGVGPCEPSAASSRSFSPSAGRLPHVSVSCDPVSGLGAEHPVAIFEALSPSTAAYDLGDKASAYRRMPSLRHLVLVSQDKIRVEHFHRGAPDADFVLTELDSADQRLVLSAIGVEIPVSEIYAQVAFVPQGRGTASPPRN